MKFPAHSKHISPSASFSLLMLHREIFCVELEVSHIRMSIKGKATPITGLWGPEGSGRLRLQISRHSAHEGGNVVTLMHSYVY